MPHSTDPQLGRYTLLLQKLRDAVRDEDPPAQIMDILTRVNTMTYNIVQRIPDPGVPPQLTLEDYTIPEAS